MTLAVTERNLHEIADSIWESVERGKQGAMLALDANFAIGRDLLDARTRFPSDNDFGEWFQGQAFPFSLRWAWTLRVAAEHEREVRAVVGSQLLTSGQPNIEKAVAEVRRPSTPLIPYTTPSGAAYPALLDALKVIEQLASEHGVEELAQSIPVKSQERWIRRLRRSGTFLGHIAYTVEEGAPNGS